MKTDFASTALPAPPAPPPLTTAPPPPLSLQLPEQPHVFLAADNPTTATTKRSPADPAAASQRGSDITTIIHAALEKAGYRHGGLND